MYFELTAVPLRTEGMTTLAAQQYAAYRIAFTLRIAMYKSPTLG